jgi:hypothetical protein
VAVAVVALALGQGCCSEGQKVPELIEWAPAHRVTLNLHNDRDTPISIGTGAATQTIPAGGFAPITLEVFKTVPGNEFERTTTGIAQRPKPGTGQLAVRPVSEPAIVTPEGAVWILHVRVTPDEDWPIKLKPGDCLFDGVARSIRIGDEMPRRRVDLCD